ncbi:uncharacterized protein [Diabrotica undecimpunctata]|uniref:uncharacterized protein n=1 Tax=Diabrotica undecimpunctata TaxID=50387 RepID=UPI003B63CCCE
MQWNARSAVANKNSLLNFLIKEDVDIALLSETWFKNNVVYNFKGYNIVRQDRADGFAGVAVLVKTGIRFEILKLNKNFNKELLACGIKVNYDNTHLSFLSVYRCPKTKTRIEDWTNLFSQVKHPCIIGGDMNAHNALWGSSKNDNIGDQIVETLQDLDFIVMNNGQPTCQGNPGHSDSMIDITVCSPSIFTKTFWTVDSDTLGSNHYVVKIEFEYPRAVNETIYPKSKWNTKKANWDMYAEIIENTLNESGPISPNVEEKYNLLLDCINKASTQSISQYKPFKCSNFSAFKHIIVVPIPKPGKNLKLVEAYRPISLLSCVQKTLERILKARLERWLLEQNLLPKEQYGFRKGFGTLDALASLVVDIQNNYSRNNYLPALFLDIEGAYDSVCLTALKEKMTRIFQIPAQFADSIVNLYSNRLVYLRKEHMLIGPRIVNKGLPQGSVLSPILFNLYVADLYNIKINNIPFNLIQYADDFCIYTEHKEYKQAIKNLDRKHQYPLKNKVKYLGMTLDKHLTWKDHIEDMLNKCNKGINFLKSINKTWWGADVDVNLLFYRAYIRSILDYGSIFYGSASNALLNKINVIHNSALRTCLGAMKSTPIQPLYLEALEPPLNIRRNFLTEKFLTVNL